MNKLAPTTSLVADLDPSSDGVFAEHKCRVSIGRREPPCLGCTGSLPGTTCGSRGSCPAAIRGRRASDTAATSTPVGIRPRPCHDAWRLTRRLRGVPTERRRRTRTSCGIPRRSTPSIVVRLRFFPRRAPRREYRTLRSCPRGTRTRRSAPRSCASAPTRPTAW